LDLLILIIIVALALATVLNLFLRRFNIPTIIGYIFTGFMIATAFDLGSGFNGDLAHVAEFGIVFLMFTIGLEVSFKHLKAMKNEVFINGTLQVVATAFIVFLIAHYLFGIDVKASIVIGAAIALSSTAIVLKLLNESGQINSGFGKRSLGILLFQDMAVVPILLMITIFATTDSSLGELLATTALNAAIALALLYVIGKYVVRWVLKVVSGSSEIYIGAVLLIVIGSSYLAHFFGFSYSLGAFIAGMMIAETKYKHQIEADLIPFRDLLLGLFFVTIGMQINFGVIVDNLFMIVGLLVGIMTLKALIIYAIIRLKTQNRTAVKTALGLSQIGEFSLAIVALANSNALLDATVVQILIVTVVLSMIVTPFILNHISKIADIFAKETSADDVVIKSSGYKNHIIVCGYGHTGHDVVKKLEQKQVPHVIVEHDIKLVEEAKKNHKNIVFGNAAQEHVLKGLDIESASGIIIAIDNFPKLQMVVEMVHTINPHIDIIASVANEMEREILADFKLKHVVSKSEVMSDLIVEEALSCKI
jgi:CPA2 family monovalent cation:H+ antiporter-2